MNWTKEAPKKEGWYFWKRAKTMYNEATLNAYLIENNPFDSEDVENKSKFIAFEAGCEVYLPKGGWWYGPIQIKK